ncbi:MAG TPA: radical SAM protein [Polyangiales bacterium]|nr:radical SAM protein [Polyangiales bacterium]
MLERLVSEWQVPLTAMLEISDRCNEVCVHCYQQQGQKGEMTTEQVCAVLDELAELGVLLLTISGGEATLRSDFLQIVEHARRKGFAVRLFTNGLTMTRELAQALGRLALQCVEISLYSTRAEVHDFVTGVPGSFERTVGGVRALVEADVPVLIKSPVMSVNEHETEAYAAFAASLGADYGWSVGEILPREGGDRSTEAFEPEDRTRVRLMRELGGDTEPGARPTRPLDNAPCGAGATIHVEPNGELRPCTQLEVELGHALRDGIAHARATNGRLLGLRKLTWKQLHGCRECDLRAFCQHCYAAALAQAGDALGPYPGACRAAAIQYEARTGHPARILVDEASPSAGPYQALGDHTFKPLPDRVRAEDDALAAQLGWTRRAVARPPAPHMAARPGELIQIRRPGRKKSSLERIPPAGGA